MQDLRKETTLVAGHQAFESLTTLRRRLADAQGLLADTRSEVKASINIRDITWDVDGRMLSAEQSWSEKRDTTVAANPRQARSTDAQDIPTLLKELDARISTMIRTVNEEIQMVIGSVQVEAARVMRRQTEWTVVLAILAAIYLPLTLVTGIFGMNITEISSEATAPDRWSVVRAWGIIFGVTMGSILVYAVVRYVLQYWRVGKLLLKKKMKAIGGGRLYARVFGIKQRLEQMRLYQKIDKFRQKMRE
jgi:Mg2+ and Co2+ transporter CorA